MSNLEFEIRKDVCETFRRGQRGGPRFITLERLLTDDSDKHRETVTSDRV
jgi:hypothetical protein